MAESYIPDPALVELVAAAIHATHCGCASKATYDFDDGVEDWDEDYELAEAAVAALATEGRLLPPETEVRTEWAWDCARGGCWHGEEVKLPHLHEGDEKWVREVAPDIWPGGRPMRRAVGPWLPAPGTYDCCGGRRHTDDCPTGRDPRTENTEETDA